MVKKRAMRRKTTRTTWRKAKKLIIMAVIPRRHKRSDAAAGQQLWYPRRKLAVALLHVGGLGRRCGNGKRWGQNALSEGMLR